MTESTSKQPITKRIGRWGTNKVRHPELFARSTRNVSRATSTALSAIKPAPLDREEFIAGYHGRHADGGRARFKELVEQAGYSEPGLQLLHRHHVGFAISFCLAAMAALIFGFYSIVVGSDVLSIIAGAGLAAVFFAFMAAAIRHDFSAWQVRNRRFGGFAEYLEYRMGNSKRKGL